MKELFLNTFTKVVFLFYLVEAAGIESDPNHFYLFMKDNQIPQKLIRINMLRATLKIPILPAIVFYGLQMSPLWAQFSEYIHLRSIYF